MVKRACMAALDTAGMILVGTAALRAAVGELLK